MEILLTRFKRKKYGKGQGVDILAVNNRLGLECIVPSPHTKSESCAQLSSSGDVLRLVNP
jgi:hypothetical protein